MLVARIVGIFPASQTVGRTIRTVVTDGKVVSIVQVIFTLIIGFIGICVVFVSHRNYNTKTDLVKFLFFASCASGRM